MHTFSFFLLQAQQELAGLSLKSHSGSVGQTKQTTWSLLASLPALRLEDHTLAPMASKKPGSGLNDYTAGFLTQKGLLLRAVKYQGQVVVF